MATRLTTYLWLLVVGIAPLFSWGQIDSISSPKLSWKQEVQEILGQTSDTLKIKWALQEAGFWLHYSAGSTLNTGPKLLLGDFSFIDPKEEEPIPFLSSKVNLNASNFEQQLKLPLSAVQNSGYPFAAYRLLDYQINSNKLDAKLQLDRGPYISLDSLVVLGYTQIPAYLLHYELNWASNSPYSEKYFESLPALINRIEYLKSDRRPAIAFFKDHAQLYVYLQKNRANLINGVIGLNTEEGGNTSLTGDFQLRLLNTLNRGEEFKLRWRAPDAEAQEFELGVSYPYLMQSPLGISTKIQIFRQDSSFVRREAQVSFPYRLAYASFFKLGAEYFSSDPLGLEDASRFSLGSIESYRLNLGFELNRTNDAIVSTKGYWLNISLGSGQRNNSGVKAQQFKWLGDFSYYLPYRKRWIWHQKLKAEGLSGRLLQDNELFRLGGLESIRGFNEWSFFTANYSLLRSEIRYMLGQYDYLSLFGDLAFTQQNTAETTLFDRHSGLGLGINFQTNGGIFSLFLAVGQSNTSNFDFRSGKVHLAYVNRF
jgi:outer membrane protein assembly factor BamA